MTFYVDVNAFLPQNLMILKADISKTSTGRYLFLFIFICGNSKCTRIQKMKKISGEVNWVPLALRRQLFKYMPTTLSNTLLFFVENLWRISHIFATKNIGVHVQIFVKFRD